MAGHLVSPLTGTGSASNMNLADWHGRYLQQSLWTQDIRRRLFDRVKLKTGEKVLEVGVGTGAVLSQVVEDYPCQVIGIDIDRHSLRFAKSIVQTHNLIQADAHLLPIPEHTFKITYCHYLLMWVRDPARTLTEMRRVTQPGGMVIALAESDYAARIDFPPPLEQLGRLQTDALQTQGADTQMGRKLGQLFHETGLTDIEVGILAAQWSAKKFTNKDESEWNTLYSDLNSTLSDEELEYYRMINDRAYQTGGRILFIPTFYAAGRV